MTNPELALLWHSAGKIAVRTKFDPATGAPSFHLETNDAPDYAVEHVATLASKIYIDYDPANGLAVYTVFHPEGLFRITYKIIAQQDLTVLMVLEDVEALKS